MRQTTATTTITKTAETTKLSKSSLQKQRSLSLQLLLLITISVLSSTTTVVVHALSNNNNNYDTRRNVLKKASTVGGGLLFLNNNDPAYAAERVKGAAEYDFEYYMRDLLGGNRGSLSPTSTGPPIPPPRTLKGPLISLLLKQNINSDEESIPTKVLFDDLLPSNLKTEFKYKFDFYRKGAQKSFYAGRAPWKEEDISDQYYFDLTAYAFWKATSDVLSTNYKLRDVFARNIGRRIYSAIIKKKLIKQEQQVPDELLLTNTVTRTITDVLNLFVSSNYIKGYKFGNDKQQSNNTILFDEYDDADLKKEEGLNVNCLISIYEPATLLGSLQITNEKSRFIPDYIASTLSAIFESYGIRSVQYETYFVDPEYRPNPKDYFPNEQLLQFTLSGLSNNKN